MSDITGQVPTPTTGQVPNTATAPQAGDAQPQTFDAEYVRRLREEAASHRTAKTAIEQELKALRESQMSEAEKQATRLKELETQAQTWDRERKDLRTIG